MNNIYSFDCKNHLGESVSLSDYQGQVLLIVNTASKCGYTPQYEGLNELHEKYHGKDFSVLGFPCNQFGGQEPGNAEEIKNFCSSNYGVTFIISEKIEVKGEGMHPLYQWLTQKDLNGKTSSTVKWNFQKYLVNKSGKLLNYFYSMTGPLSNKITSLIE